jgi:hypothetical protein
MSKDYLDKWEERQLANLRREFAQLKGAGCIPVLMTFEEFLKI